MIGGKGAILGWKSGVFGLEKRRLNGGKGAIGRRWLGLGVDRYWTGRIWPGGLAGFTQRVGWIGFKIGLFFRLWGARARRAA